jgi:uncharacterized membrane protein YeaQ/YmgE (transglycosylase-associated protein family)
MAEPSTLTASAVTLLSGAAIATVLPFIDVYALFGAVVGASIVASTRHDLTAWKRFTSFIVSAFCGYFGAGEFIARDWAKQPFLPALIGAMVIIPLALKVLAMVPEINLRALVPSLFKSPGDRS